MPAIPRISPLYASKLTSSSTETPYSLSTETCCTFRRISFCSTTGRSMFSSTFFPTIISVRELSVASEVGTVPTYSPFLKMVTQSETLSTSFSLCVMIMIAFPSAFMFCITLKSRLVSCGVSTAVGSSRIRISAPRYSTFTISSVCFSATDMSYTFFLGSTSNPYLSQIFCIFSSTCLRDSFSFNPSITFSVAEKTSTSLKC